MTTLLSTSILLNVILLLALYFRRSDAIHDAAMAEWEVESVKKELARLQRELEECERLSGRLHKPVNRISRMYPR